MQESDIFLNTRTDEDLNVVKTGQDSVTVKKDTKEQDVVEISELVTRVADPIFREAWRGVTLLLAEDGSDQFSNFPFYAELESV